MEYSNEKLCMNSIEEVIENISNTNNTQDVNDNIITTELGADFIVGDMRFRSTLKYKSDLTYLFLDVFVISLDKDSNETMNKYLEVHTNTYNEIDLNVTIALEMTEDESNILLAALIGIYNMLKKEFYMTKISNFYKQICKNKSFCKFRLTSMLEPEKLIDEDGCYVYIFRDALPKREAKKLFELCEENVVEQLPIVVFGKEVLQPRYSKVYADENIEGQFYSGRTIPATKWPKIIKRLRDFIYLKNESFGSVKNISFKPNACLINGYVTPEHNVGFHRDKELADKLQMVCTVSLGGSRRIVYQKYDNHSEKVITYLHEGDILYMWGKTNIDWEHSISKPLKTDIKKDEKYSAPRYSCTFRVIQSSPVGK